MARSLRGHLAVEGVSEQSLKSPSRPSPTIFYSSEFEIALDLNVDDGYGSSFKHVGARGLSTKKACG